MKLAVFLAFNESMHALADAGQAERFVEYYLRPYSESFEHVYVFSWSNEEYTFPFPNVTLIPNRRWPAYVYNISLAFVHRAVLRHCSHIRLMQSTAIIPAWFSKLQHGIPIIATYGFPYSKFLRVRGRRVRAFLWDMIERLLLRAVDAFIVTYQDTATHLTSIGIPKDRITTLPNGVDTEQFIPASTGAADIPRLLFVGRMEPEKNVINLAHALAQVALKYEFVLHCIGSGRHERAVRNILDDANVTYTFRDSLPHHELVTEYQQADIFLLPSVAEGYPKVLIEALACGLAAVVGAYPGHDRIITDGVNGIVCGHSPEAIKEAVVRLLHDPELRHTLGTNGRSYVLANNNIRDIVAKELNLIQSLHANT